MFGSSIKRRWQVLMLALLTLAMVLPGLANLPVIDRDEARYAQASVQMAENGDLLNIKFQDEARNKKPAGAYWLQTAMIKTFTETGERHIWVQRLPSVFGALLSILLLYWGGLKLVGRQAACLGAALMAVSLLFVFEGHIAKTDALLGATTTAIFAAIARLRNGGGRLEAWVFWIALGLSIMIKGPIGLLIATLSILGLWVWEREVKWAKPLINIGAIIIFFLLWVPWAIAIYIATDGAFFAESLGNDLGGKVISAQENHSGWPGYHLAHITLTLWPASLFLLPGLSYGFKTVRVGGETALAKAMRFCLVWIIPFWVIIEIMPTKLPHYALPVYPALCMMMGAGILAMHHLGEFTKSRFINGCLFILASAGVIAALLFAQTQYGVVESEGLTYIICAIGGLIALVAGLAMLDGKIRTAFISSLLAALLLSAGTYAYILPQIDNFRTSERFAAFLQEVAPDIKPNQIHSPHYSEPSLVYHLGKDINVKGGLIDIEKTPLIILDTRRETILQDSREVTKAVRAANLCLETSKALNGFNYAKGDEISLIILQAVPCPASAP